MQVTITDKRGNVRKVWKKKPVVTSPSISATDLTCVVCNNLPKGRSGWEIITLNGVTVHSACERQLQSTFDAVETKVLYDGDVLRWDSNGNCPMDDFMDTSLRAGLVTRKQYDATTKARYEEVQKFLEEYRANPPQPTEEEIYEMRAAFGEGAEVVNIITGQKTKL